MGVSLHCPNGSTCTFVSYFPGESLSRPRKVDRGQSGMGWVGIREDIGSATAPDTALSLNYPLISPASTYHPYSSFCLVHNPLIPCLSPVQTCQRQSIFWIAAAARLSSIVCCLSQQQQSTVRSGGSVAHRFMK